MNRRLLRAGGLLMAGVLFWGLAAHLVAPAMIRATHAGRIPLLGRLMPGLADHPVEGYLRAWEPLARATTATVATLALLVAAGLALRSQARRLAARPALPPAGPAGLVLVACWLGLLAGLGEAWYILQRAFYRGLVVPGLLNASQHTVWMTPLAGLLALGALGVAGATLHRLAPARIPPRTVVVALMAIGLFGLVMATGRLHWAAAAILGLGAALRLRGVVSPGAGELVGAARRSMGWLVVAIALAGALVPLGEWWRERRQLAAAGPVAPGAPNVLFIVLDTERAASTSLHGNARRTTPFLEELAAGGIWYERAIAPSSWTLPSHAAMFTGKRVRDLAVSWHVPLAAEHTTIAEVLARRGYATAGFVGNQYYGSDLFGLDQGFGRWEDQPVQAGVVLRHGWLTRRISSHARRVSGNHEELGRKNADRVNSDFLAWLARSRDLPFFAFLNYFDAHDPYQPPPPFDLIYADSRPRYWFESERVDDHTVQDRKELQTAYESAIAYLDDRLRSLFASLMGMGVLDNTIVIVTSDHGEVFGENGRMGHGYDLAMPLVHVPLVILTPGRPRSAAIVSEPVELRHLAATILDLVGITDLRIQGKSLFSVALGSGLNTAGIGLAEEGSLAAVVTGEHQLIIGPADSVRLFNHGEDPLGLINLASRPGYSALTDSLRSILRRAVEQP